MRQAGATLHRGARPSHYHGLSRCGAQAPDAQAQQVWCTGPVAPRHVASSQTRARTRVPCIGRQTPNHCATREALHFLLSFEVKLLIFFLSLCYVNTTSSIFILSLSSFIVCPYLPCKSALYCFIIRTKSHHFMDILNIVC